MINVKKLLLSIAVFGAANLQAAPSLSSRAQQVLSDVRGEYDKLEAFVKTVCNDEQVRTELLKKIQQTSRAAAFTANDICQGNISNGVHFIVPGSNVKLSPALVNSLCQCAGLWVAVSTVMFALKALTNGKKEMARVWSEKNPEKFNWYNPFKSVPAYVKLYFRTLFGNDWNPIVKGLTTSVIVVLSAKTYFSQSGN